MIHTCTFESSVGILRLFSRGDALVALSLPDRDAPPEGIEKLTPVLRETRAQLAAYFAGDDLRFDLPLAPEGTPFQRKVWDALLEIPAGATATYGEIAARIGKPHAARAVGMANHDNPIAIIIPCHRVIGANKKLTGYGGGLPMKAWLLSHESVAGLRAPARA
jgi:methylated-DNA-[protein]-cysteine S-methyltransferase